MKVSRTWLEKYFDAPLPGAEAIADALTFHSSEVEEVAGDMLDVNILPDRACYALSHRGVAYELAASLDRPLAHDPFATPPPEIPTTDELSVTVCDSALVPRYMATLVRGVKVGPSPAWLVDALAAVGQRSINNIVDATNYVMLNIGQPLHAFDAGQLTAKDGVVGLSVRTAYEGESMTTLTGETYPLPEGTLVIADAATDEAVDIAGIKGGKSSGVTEATTDLVMEAANFDATSIRRAAQALKLWTDASLRFQNRISPDLVAYGMRDVLALILEIAGGNVIGGVDLYPAATMLPAVTVTLARINAVLGTSYEVADVEKALSRLMLPYSNDGDVFTVSPPFIRRDLTIPEDLVEEVGRILGYENVPATELPPRSGGVDQAKFHGTERLRDLLEERGYLEISTPSFTASGEIELANPLQSDRPFLRPDLSMNMVEALVRARRVAPRVLGPVPCVKLFEIGTVFTNSGEHLALALGYEALESSASHTEFDDDVKALGELLSEAALGAPGKVSTFEIPLIDTELERLGKDYEPKRIALGPFQPFSNYPFALRDVAVWTPAGTEESEVALLIEKEAGELLVRIDLFDRFEKDERISYAFRLVFEAPDRTLADSDLDPLMERVTRALNAREGWNVR